MRKINGTRVFITAVFTFLAASACMDNDSSSSVYTGIPTVMNADIVLNDRHTGWKTGDCAACHTIESLLASVGGSRFHEESNPADGDFSACILCHGGNGLHSDKDYDRCSNCHAATSPIVRKTNKGFMETHETFYVSDDGNCLLCHSVENHPSKKTGLKPMDDYQCIECHADVSHGFLRSCVRGGCHAPVTDFLRDKDEIIIGHNGK